MEPDRAVGRAGDDGHAGALRGELEGVEELVDDVVALDLKQERKTFFFFFFFLRERERKK